MEDVKLYAEVTIKVPLNDESEAVNILLTKLVEIEKAMKPKSRRRRRSVSKRYCEVEGCGGDHRARGMCIYHYSQWQKGEILSPNGEEYAGATDASK